MSRSHVLRGKLGPMRRDGASEELIEETKRELKTEVAADYLRSVVYSAPKLNADQIERLRSLLPPVPRDEAATAA